MKNNTSKWMSIVLLTLVTLLMTETHVMSQVPQAFHYQAVARDASGNVKANSTIGVRVRIHQGSESGTVVYSETHAPSTSEIGSFTLEIGRGNSSGGSFGEINWIDGPHFLALAVDINGGTDFLDMGATKLLSVPFALVSQTSVEGGGQLDLQNININTDNGEEGITINATGSNSIAPVLRVESQTGGFNLGIVGTATTTPDNDQPGYGIRGNANGSGTGTQIGVLGSAVNAEGTGGRRYGLYGQASSSGIENIGAFAVALGPGNGDINTDLSSSNVGSVNSGVVGFATQNLNFNLGVRGRVYGNAGARENMGVQGFAETNASGRNIGVASFSFNSQTTNIGVLSSVGFSGSTPENIGLLMYVRRGGRSIGAEIHADTALVLHGMTKSYGDVQVFGNLSYSGSLSQTSDLQLKDRLAPLSSGLNVIMQLQPYSYVFKGNGRYLGLPLSTGNHVGLIAQDVERVLPDLVGQHVHYYTESISGDETSVPGTESSVITKELNYKTVNYTELIPYLIKAIQEQQSQIEEQQRQIEYLRKKLEN